MIIVFMDVDIETFLSFFSASSFDNAYIFSEDIVRKLGQISILLNLEKDACIELKNINLLTPKYEAFGKLS